MYFKSIKSFKKTSLKTLFSNLGVFNEIVANWRGWMDERAAGGGEMVREVWRPVGAWPQGRGHIATTSSQPATGEAWLDLLGPQVNRLFENIFGVNISHPKDIISQFRHYIIYLWKDSISQFRYYSIYLWLSMYFRNKKFQNILNHCGYMICLCQYQKHEISLL